VKISACNKHFYSPVGAGEEATVAVLAAVDIVTTALLTEAT